VLCGGKGSWEGARHRPQLWRGHTHQLTPHPLPAAHPHTGKQPLKMVVKPETALVRPFVVCAVLRGVTLNKARYESFIDLQVRAFCYLLLLAVTCCCA
jgi:hypothetical protein